MNTLKERGNKMENMEVTKVIAGEYTKMNHRERRLLAKKLQPNSKCKKHNRRLSLHGTELICDKCRLEAREQKALINEMKETT